jgi:hypothetical protein
MADTTDDLNVVAEYYETILREGQEELGIADVYYGDQVNIPRVPTVCVISGRKKRELRNSPRGTENTMTVTVRVYHYRVEDMGSESSRAADKLAESIERYLHQFKYYNLGGLVTHQFVTTVDPMFQPRGGNQYKVTNLEVEAKSLTLLPYQ